MPGTPQPQSQREDLDSSQDSEGPQDQCVEESLRGDDIEEDVPCSQEEGTLHSRLAHFVKQRQSLHQAMLLQKEPLWLKDLYAQVKQAGIKCSVNQLQVKGNLVSHDWPSNNLSL